MYISDFVNSEVLIANKISDKKNYIESSCFDTEYEGDKKTVNSFGEEWISFDHNDLTHSETAAQEYFDIFPLEKFQKHWLVADIGCGTGRWARRISPYVKNLFGVDPSDAIHVFANNTKDSSNIIPVKAYAENLPFQTGSLDAAVSLGVLHHIKNTEICVKEISRTLKPGGAFLFYFYYSLDNRSNAYKMLFLMSNIVRKIISSLSPNLKNILCDLISIFVYMPLIILARLTTKIFGEKLGASLPLAGYRNKNYYIIRNDSRDRFGTPLEKRYSKIEIELMLKQNGFSDVYFSNTIPYWHGYAIK